MSKARSVQRFVINPKTGRSEKKLDHFVWLRDNADEQAATELGYSQLMQWFRGMRLIWCDSREEAVDMCVAVNNKRNAILLPPGSDPLKLQKKKDEE